jgi:hypothetical protein
VIPNAPDSAVILQKTAGDVERNIGTVDGAAKGQEELRDNFLAVILDKNLVAKQFNLALGGIDVRAQLGEVKDPLHNERIVRVDVNPEVGIFLEGIQVAVKLQVVLVFEL